MFNVLWNILLGIVGGIISSVIVSRVFLIQNEHQQQIKFVEGIVRKLGAIKGYLTACETVFEVSYDERNHKEREMRDKGYKCEEEYYAVHRDKDWISVKDVIEKFRSMMLEHVESIRSEIFNSNIDDRDLEDVLHDINEYLYDISSTKELNFSSLKRFKKSEQVILDKYDNCKRISGKQLMKLVLKDKVMIVLYILLLLIIVATVLAFVLGI